MVDFAEIFVACRTTKPLSGVFNFIVKRVKDKSGNSWASLHHSIALGSNMCAATSVRYLTGSFHCNKQKLDVNNAYILGSWKVIMSPYYTLIYDKCKV